MPGIENAIWMQGLSDDEIIRALRAASNGGLAARDPEAATAPLRDDAIVLVSTGSIISGRAAMRDVLVRSFAAHGPLTICRTPDVIEVSGDRAAEHGRWSIDRAGEPGRSKHGPYLAHWKRDGVDWTLARELYIALD